VGGAVVDAAEVVAGVAPFWSAASTEAAAGSSPLKNQNRPATASTTAGVTNAPPMIAIRRIATPFHASRLSGHRNQCRRGEDGGV